LLLITHFVAIYLLMRPQPKDVDLARLGKCRLAVRIVRAPHHIVDADDVAQANADGVLLETQHDFAVEEVSWEHAVLEAVDRFAVALAVSLRSLWERA
jgi:hypothetical protein